MEILVLTNLITIVYKQSEKYIEPGIIYLFIIGNNVFSNWFGKLVVNNEDMIYDEKKMLRP